MLNSIIHSHKLIKNLIVQKIRLGIKTTTYQVYEMILNEYNSLIQSYSNNNCCINGYNFGNLKQLKDILLQFKNIYILIKLEDLFPFIFIIQKMLKMNLILKQLFLKKKIIFYECSSLTSLNLSNFNTNNVNNMSAMF